MLEVFSKDRETDFEFFRFTNGHVNYLTKNIYDMDEQEIDFYCGLPSGTILIDNEPIDVDNVSSSTTTLASPPTLILSEQSNISISYWT